MVLPGTTFDLQQAMTSTRRLPQKATPHDNLWGAKASCLEVMRREVPPTQAESLIGGPCWRSGERSATAVLPVLLQLTRIRSRPESETEEIRSCPRYRNNTDPRRHRQPIATTRTHIPRKMLVTIPMRNRKTEGMGAVFFRAGRPRPIDE